MIRFLKGKFERKGKIYLEVPTAIVGSPPPVEPPPPPPPVEPPPASYTGTVEFIAYHNGSEVSRATGNNAMISMQGYRTAVFQVLAPTTSDIYLYFSGYAEDFSQSFSGASRHISSGSFDAEAEWGAYADAPVVLYGASIYILPFPTNVNGSVRIDLYL